MRKLLIVYTLTLILAIIISSCSFFIGRNYDLEMYFSDDLPQSILALFWHNFKLYFIYRIPLLGIIQYGFSFFIVFVSIGLSFAHHGFIFSLSKLYHFPLEVLSLCIPAVLSCSRFKNVRSEIYSLLLSAGLLLFAATLEFSL